MLANPDYRFFLLGESAQEFQVMFFKHVVHCTSIQIILRDDYDKK